jgi:hypothetical protein
MYKAELRPVQHYSAVLAGRNPRRKIRSWGGRYSLQATRQSAVIICRQGCSGKDILISGVIKIPGNFVYIVTSLIKL